MIRILIATALLIAAFTVSAFAANTFSVTANVGLVEGVSYNGGTAGDVTFTIGETQLNNTFADSGDPDDYVTYFSNRTGGADVTFTATDSASQLGLTVYGSVGGGSDAPFDGNGVGTEVVNSATVLGSKNTAVLGFDISKYRLTGLSWSTSQGDHTMTATYTIGAHD